ncbi:MAG: hypothetical protein LBG83_02780 [Oscillospiraceae bacterium]|jgi:alpha-tubulin suppressor-like RCC1 family protein|nr:hypothetical protein [Oscillospiraceae bacterium]
MKSMKKSKKLITAMIAVVAAAALIVSACLLMTGTVAGDPSTSNTAPRYGRINDQKFVGVSVGYYFGGALDDQGRVWVYGTNGSGQLGNGTSISTTTGQGYAGAMQPVPNLPPIKQFSAGESYGMALDYDGDLWAWGYNCEFQVGNFKLGGNVAQRLPIKLDRAAYGIPKLEKVDAGVFHSVALDENGEVWCWGLNNAGQLGNNKPDLGVSYKNDAPGKALFPAGVKIVDIQAGRDNTIALDDQGNVWAWGRNSYAECANGKLTFVKVPTKINFPAGTVIAQISFSQEWGMALDTAGNAWQWGRCWGQTGYGTIKYLTAPQLVEFDATARIQAPTKGLERAKIVYDNTYEYPGAAKVIGGHRTSYVIDLNGKIWTLGDNEFYGFGVVTDYYAADYCRLPVWSKKAIQTPTITGNGDQDIYGKQLNWLHPQVSGSATDPTTHLEYKVYFKRDFPNGFWNETGLGIDPDYAEVPMPYAVDIATFTSNYVVLDADGNLWQWSYDSIGTICWGTESMNDVLPSHAKWKDSGLWDLFNYEPTLMRGAGINKIKTKTPEVTDLYMYPNASAVRGNGIAGATVTLLSDKVPNGAITGTVAANGTFLFATMGYGLAAGDVITITQYDASYDLPSEGVSLNVVI